MHFHIKIVSYNSNYNSQAMSVYQSSSSGGSISYAGAGGFKEKLCCGRGCGAMCVKNG